jgi:serine/threonine protein kinase
MGGMGEVFRAKDTRLRRPVALKFLRRDRAADLTQRGRLLQEARTVSTLNHPNIVVVHDIASHHGDDVLVMEYVSGIPLNILIERERLSVSRIAEIGAQIASALGAAHATGILHRDIKPGTFLSRRRTESSEASSGAVGHCGHGRLMDGHGALAVHDRWKVLYLVIGFGDEAILTLLRVAQRRFVVRSGQVRGQHLL